MADEVLSAAEVRKLASRCVQAIAAAFVDGPTNLRGWSKYYLNDPSEIGIWGTVNGIEGLTVGRALGIGTDKTHPEWHTMQAKGIEFLCTRQAKGGGNKGAWSMTQLSRPFFVDTTAGAVRAILRSGPHEQRHIDSARCGTDWLVRHCLRTGGWSYLEQSSADASTAKICPTVLGILALQEALHLDILNHEQGRRAESCLRDAVGALETGIRSDPRYPGAAGWGRELRSQRPEAAYTAQAMVALSTVGEDEFLSAHGNPLLELFRRCHRQTESRDFHEQPWPIMRDIWTPSSQVLSERFMHHFTAAWAVQALAGCDLNDTSALLTDGMRWIVNADEGGKFFDYAGTPHMYAAVDALRACSAYLQADISMIAPEPKSVPADIRHLRKAIELARKCENEDDRVHPKVGVVILKDDRVVEAAFRGELARGEHAEFTALERKCIDKDLKGATLITTLEPCTTRHHPKIPCARRIVQRGIKRVIIGMLDPDPRIRGEGELLLLDHRVRIDHFPAELKAEVWEMNRDFVNEQKRLPKQTHGTDYPEPDVARGRRRPRTH